MTASVVGVVFVMSNLLVFVDGGRRLALVSSSSDANLEIATTSTVSPNTKTAEGSQRSRTAGWCHVDDIPKTFGRKTDRSPSNATAVEFPPLSVITVKCRSQPSVTVRLVCSSAANASWTTENELDGDKTVSKSNRTAVDCQSSASSSSSSSAVSASQNALMQMTPKFRTPVSALTGGLMQSSSTLGGGGGGGGGSGVSVSHRMTSVILCVAFTVFFTTFSLAMKLIMDKYEVRGFLRVGRRSQRSDRQGEQDGSRRSTSLGMDSTNRHRHMRTRNQARDDPRLTAIATLSGQLNVYRPAHVHVVFTTVVDGGRTSLTVIRPMLQSALQPSRQSSSDIVPSYEEALALEQPPPTYEQVTQATHSSSASVGGTERELSVKLAAN